MQTERKSDLTHQDILNELDEISSSWLQKAPQ